MAKQGTLEHPKVKRLARHLGCIVGIAYGLYSTVIDRANEYYKDGHFTTRDVEDALDAGGWLTMFEPMAVISAMIECGLFDPLTDGYYLHDFHEHAETSTKMSLMRSRRYFANGVQPTSTRMEAKERKPIEEWYEANPFSAHAVYTESARNVHEGEDLKGVHAVHTPCTPPKPIPSPKPVPIPEPNPKPSPIPEPIPSPENVGETEGGVPNSDRVPVPASRNRSSHGMASLRDAANGPERRNGRRLPPPDDPDDIEATRQELERQKARLRGEA